MGLASRIFRGRAEPANDDRLSRAMVAVDVIDDDGEPISIHYTLDDLERQIIAARNRVVSCQAELHKAERDLADARGRLRDEIGKRRLLE